MISFSAFLTELVHSVVGKHIYNFQPFLTRAEVIGLLPEISQVYISYKFLMTGNFRVQRKSIFRLTPSGKL